MLLGAFNPLQAFVMTLMINARHLFYGISMLDKYRNTGWKKGVPDFGMCDESFTINYTAKIPEDVDRGWFMFFVTLLNYFYWFSGSTLGGIFGSLLKFNTEGLDFVMTAMFVVIFMEQWLKEKNHVSSLLGLGLSLLCLLAFGAENFMIPAMAAIIGVLTLLRKPIEKERKSANDSYAADHNDCYGGSGHHAHTLSALSAFSRGKTDSQVHTVSWQGAAGVCLWAAGHLLPEECKCFYRQSRHTRTSGYSAGGGASSLETADAVIYSRGHGVLHDFSTDGFLNKSIDSPIMLHPIL